tara:strand:- start:190 stop:315 length:126 start_codon:yes stop_codon:yes gene_type:complete
MSGSEDDAAERGAAILARFMAIKSSFPSFSFVIGQEPSVSM